MCQFLAKFLPNLCQIFASLFVLLFLPEAGCYFVFCEIRQSLAGGVEDGVIFLLPRGQACEVVGGAGAELRDGHGDPIAQSKDLIGQNEATAQRLRKEASGVDDLRRYLNRSEDFPIFDHIKEYTMKRISCQYKIDTACVREICGNGVHRLFRYCGQIWLQNVPTREGWGPRRLA